MRLQAEKRRRSVRSLGEPNQQRSAAGGRTMPGGLAPAFGLQPFHVVREPLRTSCWHNSETTNLDTYPSASPTLLERRQLHVEFQRAPSETERPDIRIGGASRGHHASEQAESALHHSPSRFRSRVHPCPVRLKAATRHIFIFFQTRDQHIRSSHPTPPEDVVGRVGSYRIFRRPRVIGRLPPCQIGELHKMYPRCSQLRPGWGAVAVNLSLAGASHLGCWGNPVVSGVEPGISTSVLRAMNYALLGVVAKRRRIRLRLPAHTIITRREGLRSGREGDSLHVLRAMHGNATRFLLWS